MLTITSARPTALRRLSSHVSHAAASQAARIRQQSTTHALAQSLTNRRLPILFDDLSPLPSHRLTQTLSSFLGTPSLPPTPLYPPPPNHPSLLLPLAHHQVYFEPCIPTNDLLPDGTDPATSPGEPWTRRLWAGGRVRYASAGAEGEGAHRLRLGGGGAEGLGVCAEFIQDAKESTHASRAGAEAVEQQQQQQQQKVHLTIHRRLARATPDEISLLREIESGRDGGGAQQQQQSAGERYATLEHRVRQRLWRPDKAGELELGPCGVVEERKLVFLRGPGEEGAEGSRRRERRKIALPRSFVSSGLDSASGDGWTHALTPTRHLLFRFSALSFNAHAIHYDPLWSREVEGHDGLGASASDNLLLHGPLSYVIMLTLLGRRLRSEGRGEVVKDVEYRNLGPVFCGDEARVSGKRTEDGRWAVWMETEEGGLAVSMSVRTVGEVEQKG